MNNKDGVLAKIVGFAEDKGFYIILMLCVIAIGISGYVLFFLPEAEEGVGLGLTDGLEPGLPSANEVVPDYTPQIPDVTVQLEPDKKADAAAPATVPDKAETVNQEPAEETWLFKKSPEYLMPVSGEVIRQFSIDALLYDKTMDDWRTHNGIDISCTLGDDVMAIADGAVEKVYEDSLLGNIVVVAHSDGLKSIYCGLEPNTTMANGMEVKAGDAIGTAGNTNKTESLMEAHVHLSVTKDGQYIDPQGLKLK